MQTGQWALARAWTVNSVIALSPVSSYLDTILAIHKHRSRAGFSIDLYALLLVGNILRVFFYLGRPYELSLLVQSGIMILTQLALLSSALRYRAAVPETVLCANETHEPLCKRHPSSKWTYRVGHSTGVGWVALVLLGSHVRRRAPGSERPFGFWQWTESWVYYSFLVRFSMTLVVMHVLLGSYPLYIDTIGLCGLLTEAFVPLPQILTNYRSRSVAGVRGWMLVSWLCGDVSKLLYLALGDARLAGQFLVCAVVQFFLDILVLYQYFTYPG